MDVLGLDIGFGFTKATDGKEFMMFKSILGDATEIQFRSELEAGSSTNSLHITLDGNSFFIGDFAEQQSFDRQFTLDQERLITDFVKILSLTVAGRFSGQEGPLHVVSGLPVGYFKNNHKRFASILTGKHAITYHKVDGKALTKNIFIQKIRMMPQPLGSFFNILLNDKGKMVNIELTKKKVGVIDVGFRTTDITIFDKLRYVERASTTLDFGISKCFSVLANKLREKSTVNVELFRLYSAAHKGMIRIRGQEYNLSEIRDQVYCQLATAIAGEANRLWADEWDLDSIILTGGGSIALGKYLSSHIIGNVVSIEQGMDARLNNVQGFYKYGKYIWGETILRTPQVLADDRAKASK